MAIVTVMEAVKDNNDGGGLTMAFIYVILLHKASYSDIKILVK